jgi:hypothetical protein
MFMHRLKFGYTLGRLSLIKIIGKTMFRNIVIILIAFASQMVSALDYTQEITEQEIQEKVSALMPVVKKKYFVTVKISDPKIDLIKEINEVGILANIDASAPGGIKGNGEVMIQGALDYDANKGAFYFKNPKIISLKIDQVPANFIPDIQALAQTALTNALATYPVYQFKDDHLKHRLAKSVLKSLKVQNEKLLITLSAF